MDKNTEPPEQDNDSTEPELFEAIFYDILKSKYGIEKEELEKFSQNKRTLIEASFPIAILRVEELSSLEAIVKYLRENKNYSYKKIGSLLNRNPKTLAVTYNISRKKKKDAHDNSIEADKLRVPFSAFDNNLSILEAICVFLKSQGRSYSEIAKLINRDPRTIWTVCKRADKKMQGENKS